MSALFSQALEVLTGFNAAQLLGRRLEYIMRDEARHLGLGVVSACLRGVCTQRCLSGTLFLRRVCVCVLLRDRSFGHYRGFRIANIDASSRTGCPRLHTLASKQLDEGLRQGTG